MKVEMNVPDIKYIGAKILRFCVDGVSVPQQRVKFGKGKAYEPKKSREYKAKVIQQIKEAMHNCCWQMPIEEAPIQMRMVVYKQLPLSLSKFYKEAGEHGIVAPVTKTGDVDNIAKTIMDAANGLAYKDDCQIYSLHCEMRYSFYPRVEVEFEVKFVNWQDVKDDVNAKRTPEFTEKYLAYKEEELARKKDLKKETALKVLNGEL